MKKLLTTAAGHAKIQFARLTTSKYGGIAQLGERLNGIQEVSGSIPLISTKKKDLKLRFQVFFMLN